MHYSTLHWRNARRCLKRFTDSLPKDEIWLVSILGTREAEHRYNLFLRDVGAHLTACLESMDAVPDILAHAAYFSLAMDKSVRLAPQEVNCRKLRALLNDDSQFVGIAAPFVEMLDCPKFLHLRAMCNRAKHRSQEFARYGEWQEIGSTQVGLCFPSFSHQHGKLVDAFPAVAALPFLLNAGMELKLNMVRVGNALNAHLGALA
jgi:hypothetical protein